jgi:GNAT superfamily N-acetyltransferase
VGEAFGLPVDDVALMLGPATSGEGSLRAWLLEEDGEVVSALVSGHVDDSISLWSMATPARLARRGYGRVLLASVLAHAQADGARIGLLGATPAGLPLYSATGWATVEEWHIFTNATSAQFAH